MKNQQKNTNTSFKRGIPCVFQWPWAIMRKKPQYWYKIYLGACPVCGRNKSYRERVYGPRPPKREDRYVWLSDQETYDGCMG